jgi:UDP-sugar pyrophosphorylase
MNQLQRMDQAYSDGGIVGYIRNAKVLLEKSKQGLNPLDGWVPSVPQGQLFQLGTTEYSEYESLGMAELGKCGFILVAGGLGERLGYSGIKVCL